MKRLKVAKHPVSFCVSFRPWIGHMSSMAFMFVGFASVPRVEMMYPNNLPEGTPKVHYVGFSFMSNLLKFSNVPKRSQIRSSVFFDLMTTSST